MEKPVRNLFTNYQYFFVVFRFRQEKKGLIVSLSCAKIDKIM